MKTIILTTIFFIVTVSAADAQTTSMISCPPNTYMQIDPPPPPTDDPAKPDDYKPMTAFEKEQAAKLANQDALARMHCVPMTDDTPQQQ